MPQNCVLLLEILRGDHDLKISNQIKPNFELEKMEISLEKNKQKNNSLIKIFEYKLKLNDNILVLDEKRIKNFIIKITENGYSIQSEFTDKKIPYIKINFIKVKFNSRITSS